jgi:hypothetical protein
LITLLRGALAGVGAVAEQATPEFLGHAGLAHQLSCSITTVHKLRSEGVLGEPCMIGNLVRWHWPTVRAKILTAAAAARQQEALAGDPFLDRLDAVV